MAYLCVFLSLQRQMDRGWILLLVGYPKSPKKGLGSSNDNFFGQDPRPLFLFAPRMNRFERQPDFLASMSAIV